MPAGQGAAGVVERVRPPRSDGFGAGNHGDADPSDRVGHHHPAAQFAPTPTSTTADSKAHRFVWAASALAATEPSTGASLALAPANAGISARDTAASTTPTVLASGLVPPIRSPSDSYAT